MRPTRSRQRLVYRCARSSHPLFAEAYRLDDATRFNSSNHQVNLYQDYPNRSSVPKPPPLTAPVKKRDPITPELYAEVMKLVRAQGLRMRTATTVRVFGGQKRLPDVMNDFHVRETNPGFARNELGGFFMR